jgi:hypothetical protein
MKRPAITRIAALGLLCLALAVVWIWISLNPAEPVGVALAPAPASAQPTNVEPPLFNMPPMAAFSEIAARPVFIPSRRPIPPPAALTLAAAPAPAPPPPPAPPPQINLTLVGIMIGDEGRYALVRSAGSQTVTTLAEGQEIGGWQVYLILPDRIVLRVANIETEIMFPVLSPSQPGVAPAVSRPSTSPAPRLGEIVPKQPS